jgi:hypothetical protein
LDIVPGRYELKFFFSRLRSEPSRHLQRAYALSLELRAHLPDETDDPIIRVVAQMVREHPPVLFSYRLELLVAIQRASQQLDFLAFYS